MFVEKSKIQTDSVDVSCVTRRGGDVSSNKGQRGDVKFGFVSHPSVYSIHRPDLSLEIVSGRDRLRVLKNKRDIENRVLKDLW